MAVFNFYTYVFSAAVLAIFYLMARTKTGQQRAKMPWKVYAFVAVMAVCLFGCSIFNTVAAKHLSAAQLYPLSQGAGVILSLIMSAAFFGEKIKVALVMGVCLDFAGLLVINLL